jgi:uncharacterized protein (TIGR03083 family)
MDRIAYLAALRRDGDAVADLAARAGLEAPVPSCPGWDVAELVWHLGLVHRFWAGVVERLLQAPEEPEVSRPDDAGLIAWYRTGLDHLIDVLATADESAAVWTWSHQQDVAFVVRRQAQETAVHRADAELAAGEAPGIEPTLASDGIDELLEHMLRWPVESAPPLAGTVHLHCTDVDGEWLAWEGDDRALVVERRHAKGDVALRGPASDLLLALWRREPLSTVEVLGDAMVAERLLARSPLG